MASLFRPHRRSPEPDLAGDKALRSRPRAPLTASPFHSAPPPPQPRNPSWISGVLAGAGKFISSVFVSDDSSSEYSSDDDTISISSEDEDTDTSAPELREPYVGEHSLMKAHVEASSSIVPRSESKLAIEQLLMHESFTRDESKILMDILQSRVVDCPSAEVGEGGSQLRTHSKTSGRAISFLGGYQSLHPHIGRQNTTTHSTDMLNSVSPEFSDLQARKTDFSCITVMEAKKWLEQEKSASSLNANLNYGRCTLNTDTLDDAFKSELASPVDIAKSYMRSLPLRHSPSLCSSGFRTLQPSGTLLYKDGTYAPTNNSFPSSKVLKRKYLDPEPWNIHDDLRRVCIKSKDNLLVTTNDEQIDHSMSLLETEAFTISSATEERKLSAENHFVNGALSLPDEKAIEVNCYVETGNAPPISITSKLDKVLNAGQPTNGSPMPTIPLPSHSEFGIEFSHNEDNIFHKIKDVEGPLQIKDGVSSFPLPNGSLVLPNPLMDHDVSRHPNRDAELPEIVHDSEDAPAEYMTDSRLTTSNKGGPNPTNSNNNEPDVLNPREAYELISEAAVKLPNGTRMKSMERILAETKPMVRPWKRSRTGLERSKPQTKKMKNRGRSLLSRDIPVLLLPGSRAALLKPGDKGWRQDRGWCHAGIKWEVGLRPWPAHQPCCFVVGPCRVFRCLESPQPDPHLPAKKEMTKTGVLSLADIMGCPMGCGAMAAADIICLVLP